MKKETEKILVLGVLFIFPVFIYLFFASGKNNFAKLPVLTTNVFEVSDFTSLNGKDVSLKGHITVLCYWGSDISLKKGEAFNLNQKIYKRFYKFKDFQFVILITEDQEDEVMGLKEELKSGVGTDLINWKFLKGSVNAIHKHFLSLNAPLNLDSKNSSPYAFIIDRNLNLRGRDDDDIGTLYGFDARSVAEINNKMEDDIKVILAEYRLALKKYSIR
ncbi:MAG: hypothetical protein CMC79_04410 [Flavobacteriaceae bacterium]|nr:hypothetical protein [Flavobacteriaceae bacterium]|tara:strand:+ start:20760 stop:21410 length:651 start_codon:yes stop_codon:yes gene_type:complete